MKLQAGVTLQHREVKVLSQEKTDTHSQDSGAGHILSPKGLRKKEDKGTSQGPFFLPVS